MTEAELREGLESEHSALKDNFLYEHITEKLSSLLQIAHERLARGDVLPRDESKALVMECQRLIDSCIQSNQRFLDLAGHWLMDQKHEQTRKDSPVIYDFRRQA